MADQTPHNDPLAEHRRPLRWRDPEHPPLPSLPTLDLFMPVLPWGLEPATARQMRELRRFGLVAVRGLARIEASHLLGECIRMARPQSFAELDRLDSLRSWNVGMKVRDLRRWTREIREARKAGGLPRKRRKRRP